MDDREGPVPDMVQQFVVYLYRNIRERNVSHIQHIYDISFNKITEMHFTGGKPWPRSERISHLVEDDHVFCLLYKEMYAPPPPRAVPCARRRRPRGRITPS